MYKFRQRISIQGRCVASAHIVTTDFNPLIKELK